MSQTQNPPSEGNSGNAPQISLPPQIEWEPSPPPPTLDCTRWVCSEGQFLKATLRTAKCGGCESDGLAARVSNCPYCNEPPKKLLLRVDMLYPSNPTWARVCQGEPSAGESIGVELDRTLPFEAPPLEVTPRY